MLVRSNGSLSHQDAVCSWRYVTSGANLSMGDLTEGLLNFTSNHLITEGKEDVIVLRWVMQSVLESLSL